MRRRPRKGHDPLTPTLADPYFPPPHHTTPHHTARCAVQDMEAQSAERMKYVEQMLGGAQGRSMRANRLLYSSALAPLDLRLDGVVEAPMRPFIADRHAHVRPLSLPSAPRVSACHCVCGVRQCARCLLTSFSLPNPTPPPPQCVLPSQRTKQQAQGRHVRGHNPVDGVRPKYREFGLHAQVRPIYCRPLSVSLARPLSVSLGVGPARAGVWARLKNPSCPPSASRPCLFSPTLSS